MSAPVPQSLSAVVTLLHREVAVASERYRLEPCRENFWAWSLAEKTLGLELAARQHKQAVAR